MNVILNQAQPLQPEQPSTPEPLALPQPVPIAVPAPAPENAPRPVPPVAAPAAAEAVENSVAMKEETFIHAIPEFAIPSEGYGVMRYIVYSGEQRLEAGRAELSWIFSDGNYYLNLNTKSIDEAVPYPGAASMSSKGHIRPEGMQPEYYSLTSAGRTENVEFIRELQRITGMPDAPFLHPDSQDILSLQFQLAITLVAGRPLEFWLATDRRYELFQFILLDEETLELPAGIFRTLHLQSEGSEMTLDFWLAEDYQLPPVKTRFTNKNGEIYEQAASEIPTQSDDQPAPETEPVQPE
jgi:hypothetical protein